ncbi:hypothetical protein BGZ70_001288 [Mortierella alpina]|uniref:Uncharacterized protein n=1 Tax=Mortierella alpina TaxID=64518 RepID=A0A9P6IWK3_MORAP|nr:hypothetical protein BGZ70_001288 [Mortierella alpina]
MTATTFMNSLPSPTISIAALDITLSPIPDGQLTEDARAQLQTELEQIRKSSSESQLAYNAAHASIPTYQQLAVLHAKGISSSGSSSTTNSSSTSNASSPPSPSSPLNNHLNQDMLKSVEEHERNLQRLEQEHVELGLKLSQVLRDKAEAEETKKRLNDYMMLAKSRIKELEKKLRE